MSSTNFFEFREQVTGKKQPDKPAPALAPTTTKTKPEPMTVSQLTAVIDRAIKSGVPPSVLVKGEVSNFNAHRSSGHFYFTLKDAKSCIDCVMFRSDASRLKFLPEDGHELIAGGRIEVYAARGRYQLYVTSLHPVGRGALEIAFRQLHAKLAAEGLFATERKRPLPRFPLRVALVTSRSTAALQDMLKVLRRFTWLRLMLYDVPVQGDGAAEQIAAALHHLSRNAARSQIDVILLGRGGGSLEDLWEFNEEIVARAIAACAIPIVTGVGHEIDTTIADLVADHHAHTPTEAAQVVTAEWKTAPNYVQACGARLTSLLRTMLRDARQRLRGIERHETFRRPTHRINALRQLLDDRQRALTVALGQTLRRATARVTRLDAMLLKCHPRHEINLARHRLEGHAARLHAGITAAQARRGLRLDALQRQLDALSPQGVLRRGYSITRMKKGGAIVREKSQVKPGSRIVTRVTDGEFESTVDDTNQPRLFE
jgi:exodeoxyribonuclease VII large subunit